MFHQAVPRPRPASAPGGILWADSCPSFGCVASATASAVARRCPAWAPLEEPGATRPATQPVLAESSSCRALQGRGRFASEGAASDSPAMAETSLLAVLTPHPLLQASLLQEMAHATQSHRIPGALGQESSQTARRPIGPLRNELSSKHLAEAARTKEASPRGQASQSPAPVCPRGCPPRRPRGLGACWISCAANRFPRPPRRQRGSCQHKIAAAVFSVGARARWPAHV